MLPVQAIICLIASLLLPPHCLASQPLESYTAAVVEYHPLGNPLNGANSVLEINVANYENFIKEAAIYGADIVVFPEYGLTHTSPSDNRSEMTKYAQIVPNASLMDNQVRRSPCNEEEVSWVIKRISCSAHKNQIYVAINLPESVPCSKQDDNCPEDGFFIYNSNIVFDRYGEIISKYWKFNLFIETAINKPQKASHSTFSTDFNVTFGMFTCFDILWKEPAFDLLNTDVTDIVFPTAWFSQLPFLSAVQMQASWSYGLGVNLLAADNNNPQMGGGGSGIYSGVKGALSTYLPSITGSKLLVAKVPKIKRKISLKFQTGHKETTTQIYDISAHPWNYTELNVKYENIQKYNRSLPFQNGESTAIICSRELCCQFYADVQSYNGSTYRFVAFSGVRYLAHLYKESFQICSIIHCLGDEFHTCGHIPTSNNSKSFIHSLRISGNFNSSQMILPNSVDFQLKPVRTELFDFVRDEKEVQLRSKHRMSNILSFSIYGRDFQGDLRKATEHQVQD